MDPLYFATLAQLETAGGRKTIKGPQGEDSNNLYNIKDFSGNGYRALDKAEGSRDAYRVYPNREAATADLVSLLSRKYPKALEATTPKDFAQALKDGGYATDPAYVDKFVNVYGSMDARSAADFATDAPTAAPVPPNRTLENLYAFAQGPRPPKQFEMKKTAAAVEKAAGAYGIQVAQPDAPGWYARATSEETAGRAAKTAADQQSLLDIARAHSMETFLGDLQKWIDRPENKNDGFVPTEQDLAGFTVPEQDALRGAHNRATFDSIKFDILEHKRNLEDANKSGAGWSMLGALIAGTPEAYATGGVTSFAVAKTGLGAAKLADQGRRGAAIVSSVAENVGGNVAMTVGQDFLSPHIGLQDYVMSALGGAVVSPLHLPRILAGSRNVENKLIGEILDGELNSKVRDIEAARSQLGENATPQDVARKANELQSERIRNELQSHQAALGEDRKLLSDESRDALTGDTPEAAAPHMDAASQLAETKGAGFTEAAKVRYDDPTFLNARRWHAENSPKWQADIAANTNGQTFAAVRDLPPGVHLSSEAAANPRLAEAISSIRDLAGKYLSPESRVFIGDGTSGPAKARGSVISVDNVHMIGLNSKQDGVLHTALHELGHAIFHEKAKDIPADLLGKIRDDYSQFLNKLLSGDTDGAALQRFGITSPGAHTEPGKLPVTSYTASFDEYIAEQYTKHLTRLSVEGDSRLSSDVRRRIVDAVRTIWQFFKDIGDQFRGKGFARPDKGAHEFFSRVLDDALTTAQREDHIFAEHPAPAAASFDVPAFESPRTDAEVQATHGLDTLPTDTPAQRARVKALTELYRKAEAYPMPDPARMSKLLQTAPMQAVAPTALKLLASDNPVARMVASELLESGSGAAGRRTTASIAKWLNERAYMGNSIPDFQRVYGEWRRANGGSVIEDFWGGKKYAEFNRAVATEMENRKWKRVSDAAPAIHEAADVLEAAYDRMRVAQQQAKTPGWAALPTDSIGYMPHRMAAGKVRDLSPEQARIVHGVLAEQFQNIEGFDKAFSQRLASKYLDIMRKRATAGYSAVTNVQSSEAADIVEESVRAMGLSREEAQAMAQRVLKAAPAHTRGRLKLDLTRTYMADGKPFQLLDMFETDQLSLLRSQASRVSGETALMRHGIPGSTGLKLLRDALAFGKAGEKADNHTLEAFDQVAAEMLGQPFGKQNGKWMDRALQFNSLASLGGMGFNQLAETFNAATTLGVRHALASIGSFARLRSEILALSKGKKVNNPIIGSLETLGNGAEFGTDNYKMIFPFDMPERAHEMYGLETLTAADRLLRGGVHLQSKLSLWRAITSAQERGMAEQIVHKALRYIRDGKESKALADMGIDRELSASIRKDLGKAAVFDGNRLTQFDITKLSDGRAADAFVQAVHRGTRQIIQGSFIGETGKWAHSGLLKLMTQFKSYSLIAIDKQWNRQVGNHGTAAALGMLLGQMTMAAPIYMVRAGINSMGRKDQDAYLQKALHPYEIARQTLNYVALSGLAGDLLDATTALAGYQPSGGRSGSNKSFVGNVIAPAAGKVDDIWGALQNTKDGTDVSALARQLPFSRLPWLVPAMNSLRPEPR